MFWKMEFHISPKTVDKVGGLGRILEAWSHRMFDGAVVEGVRVKEACASVSMDPQEYTLLHT